MISNLVIVALIRRDLDIHKFFHEEQVLDEDNVGKDLIDSGTENIVDVFDNFYVVKADPRKQQYTSKLQFADAINVVSDDEEHRFRIISSVIFRGNNEKFQFLVSEMCLTISSTVSLTLLCVCRQ